MRDAIGYIRVSSEEQADSGPGLEAPRQRIRAYCEMKGLSLGTIAGDDLRGRGHFGIRRSEVLPKPKARQRCTLAPSTVGSARTSRLTVE
jgi:hypothetical protein